MAESTDSDRDGEDAVPGEMSVDARRLSIGRRFKRLRTRHGYSQAETAKLLDTSKATWSRLEVGYPIRMRMYQVERWLKLLKAAPDEAQRILDYAAKTLESDANAGFWDAYRGDALPKWATLFVSLQGIATETFEYSSELIPGLLQTPDYARAVFEAATRDPDPEKIEKSVEVRTKRQEILTRTSPLSYSAVLNEAVLRRWVGGPAVMRTQLAALVQMSSSLPNISLRVLPFRSGAHVSMASSYSILDFPIEDDGEPLEPPMAYVDTPSGSMYITEASDLDTYREAKVRLEEEALDEEKTRDLMTEVIREYS